PFPAAGIHVEGEEMVPVALGDVRARQPVDADAVDQRLATLLLHRLSLARGKRGEEVVIVRKAFVEEMELLIGPVKETRRLQRRYVGLRRESDVRGRHTKLVGHQFQASGKSGPHRV